MSAPAGAARVPERAARPVDVCRALLEALDASEGLRRRRKRNTRPDAIGIGIKREILEAAVAADPDGGSFEAWLLERCFEQGPREGAWRAMALEVFDEWRLAAAAPSFRAWLEAGAPSDDKGGPGAASSPSPARGCPVHRSAPGLLLAAGLGLAAAAALAGCGDGLESDAGDVPSVDVEAMEEPERQTAGMTTQVLPPLLAQEAAGVLVYDPPTPLARPPGAEVWPPGPDQVPATPGARAPAADSGPRPPSAAPRDTSPSTAPPPDSAGR